MLSQTDQIESSALKIGVVVNLLMAIAGWVAFSLTGSEALLLDGNFSFISNKYNTLFSLDYLLRINKDKFRKSDPHLTTEEISSKFESFCLGGN